MYYPISWAKKVAMAKESIRKTIISHEIFQLFVTWIAAKIAGISLETFHDTKRHEVHIMFAQHTIRYNI